MHFLNHNDSTYMPVTIDNEGRYKLGKPNEPRNTGY